MNRSNIAHALNKVVACLADFGHLAHFMHVNTKGIYFYQDHLLYELIYKKSLEQIDRFAERIVYLGHVALVTLGAAYNGTILPQLNLDDSSSFKEQLRYCAVTAHNLIYSTINLAREENDPVTENMLCELGELMDHFTYLLQS